MATLRTDTDQARLRYLSGPQNLVIPTAVKPSRGAVSHQWRGPGFYQSEAHQFTHPTEVSQDPVAQGLDKTASASGWPASAGISIAATEHGPAPYAERWRGRPVFYSAQHQSLSNEHAASTVAPDSRLFYNEDDWEKYKFMIGNGDIGRPSASCGSGAAAAAATTAGGRRENPNKPKDRVWYF